MATYCICSTLYSQKVLYVLLRFDCFIWQYFSILQKKQVIVTYNRKPVYFSNNYTFFEFCVEYRFHILQQLVRSSVYYIIALNNSKFLEGIYFFKLFSCYFSYKQLFKLLYVQTSGITIQQLTTKKQSDLLFYKRPAPIKPMTAQADVRKQYGMTALNSTTSLRKQRRIKEAIEAMYGMTVEEYERAAEESTVKRYKLLNEAAYDIALNITPLAIVELLNNLLILDGKLFSETY